MRIVQLIDSLEAGGAERMAVNYANVLANQLEFSGLIATRKEGLLKEQLVEKVDYLFLNKKKLVDFKAVFKLRKYVRKHKVQIIQAHSSSFFLAVLVKLTLPGLKIIWHDHYGNRIHETKKKHYTLFLASFFFSACFAVNLELQTWILKNLKAAKVFFIPNFTIESNSIVNKTYLKGEINKRIICLANLKNPKNHITILKAFNNTKLNDFSWSLHFVGKIYKDDYFYQLKSFIDENDLEESVFFYDSIEDISFVLSQASIGVLASKYEGFPVSLLEYGNAGLATISTDVGFCSSMIKDGYNGLLFNPEDSEVLKEHFLKLAFNDELQKKVGMNLKADVLKQYSYVEIIKVIITKYNYIINE
ncbi:glycosyltransferase [Flavobacterium seoulense]|uniref:Alpha-1,4-N-acetylgalactosamine transferase n=1 Tax=Flavobacterium seoulense TaxID=1492738 RepID=A0A066WYN2_9FLAO|nr:glycosyltransferase [Flavobacterium seoulense]KDN56034.1 alpha-1,4-N-acetylgalactosamine transferase [Flavobacterium seoulense]